MKKYIVTFGQKYRQEPHPKVNYANPDGYLLINAKDKKVARKAAFKELGEYWCMIYDYDQKQIDTYYPKGALHTINVT